MSHSHSQNAQLSQARRRIQSPTLIGSSARHVSRCSSIWKVQSTYCSLALSGSVLHAVQFIFKPAVLAKGSAQNHVANVEDVNVEGGIAIL